MNHQCHQIMEMINSLASDEDQRQELWVVYLSDPATFSSRAEQVLVSIALEDEIAARSVAYIRHQPSNKLLKVMEHLSEIEVSVVCLVMLGLSNYQISQYKMIGMRPLAQLLDSVATHPAWVTYGIKEKIERK